MNKSVDQLRTSSQCCSHHCNLDCARRNNCNQGPVCCLKQVDSCRLFRVEEFVRNWVSMTTVQGTSLPQDIFRSENFLTHNPAPERIRSAERMREVSSSMMRLNRALSRRNCSTSAVYCPSWDCTAAKWAFMRMRASVQVSMRQPQKQSSSSLQRTRQARC